MINIDLQQVLDLEDFLGEAPETTRKAASFAMNDVLAGSGLARYRKGITDQINLPGGYLDDDRLGVTQRATPTRLVAHITGRQRPVSLARFATSGAVGSKGGVSVKVKTRGAATFIKSAFMVRLKAGSSLSNDSFNVGLALRLKPGQTVINKRDASSMVYLDSNVVLLYGPSLDQVLRNDVAAAETPAVVDDIATEFFRQFARLSDA